MLSQHPGIYFQFPPSKKEQKYILKEKRLSVIEHPIDGKRRYEYRLDDELDDND